MKNKIGRTLLLILAVCLYGSMFTGCYEDSADRPKLAIRVQNASFSTLKHIYWQSNRSAGVLNIDVPKNTEKDITVDLLLGTQFQFMITTDDTTEYIKWVDVNASNDKQVLLSLCFDVKILESCMLAFAFDEGATTVDSTENTLPSL